MLPTSLSSHSASGLHANIPVAQFEIGNLRNFVYLVLDWRSKKAAVVDPQSNLQPLTESMQAHGFELVAILLTHTHFDHIAGVPELMHRFPKLPIYVHASDTHRLAQEYQIQISPLEDEQVIRIGELEVRTLHTPGHSAGECSFLFEVDRPYLLTGDTLFIRDCGRTDLETGSNEQMFESLQKIKKLSPQTVILPGHHYQKECASWLAAELEQSPPLRAQSVQELASLP
jgi:hydroxyacylglutathione hydrolase